MILKGWASWVANLGAYVGTAVGVLKDSEWATNAVHELGYGTGAGIALDLHSHQD